jgi:hypothetical protein
MSVLVEALNISRIRCTVLPTPLEAAVNCPGCDRASAINSFTDLADKPGCTTSIDAEWVASTTGSKSRAGSKRMLR